MLPSRNALKTKGRALDKCTGIFKEATITSLPPAGLRDSGPPIDLYEYSRLLDFSAI